MQLTYPSSVFPIPANPTACQQAAHQLHKANAISAIARSPVFLQLQPSYLTTFHRLPTGTTHGGSPPPPVLLRYIHALLQLLLTIKAYLASSPIVGAALAAFVCQTHPLLVAALKHAMEGLASDGYALTSSRLHALREEV